MLFFFFKSITAHMLASTYKERQIALKMFSYINSRIPKNNEFGLNAKLPKIEVFRLQFS